MDAKTIIAIACRFMWRLVMRYITAAGTKALMICSNLVNQKCGKKKSKGFKTAFRR